MRTLAILVAALLILGLSRARAWALATPTAVPPICPACDCSFSTIGTPTTATTGGNLSTSITITDPASNPGDQAICGVRYDVGLDGAQRPDGSWTQLGDVLLADGSGVSGFLQNYPGNGYPSTITFSNLSGSTLENWNAVCLPITWRSGVDGSPVSSTGSGTSVAAPMVTITQTLDVVFSILAASGATVMSGPDYGSIVVQANAFAPSVGIIATTGNPNLSPTSTNHATLGSSVQNGALSFALKCKAAPTPTPSATPTATATVTATASSTASPTAVATPAGSIKRFIIIDGENHSFDNVLGTLPGANGATTAQVSDGSTIPILHAPNNYPADFDHSQLAGTADINGGLMNGFDLQFNCHKNSAPTPYGCISQYYQADIPNLWTYATDFTVGDAVFADVNGPSLPNHLFLSGASSYLVNSNPVGVPTSDSWGCDSQVKASDCTAAGLCGALGICPQCTGAGTVIGSATVTTTAQRQGTTKIHPCFSQTSLLDTMASAGVTWKWYGENVPGVSGYQWMSPNNYLTHYNGTADWTSHVFIDSQFRTDAAAGGPNGVCTLPQVSFITTSDRNSGHPPQSMCSHENFIVKTLNALAAGPCWANSEVVVTYDEWGGPYDHQAPPAGTTFGPGIRVPFIFISPYSKAGIVVHTVLNAFSSIDKEIENRFSLPSLGGGDVSANDLSSFLDLTQAPLSLPTLTLNPGSSCGTN